MAISSYSTTAGSNSSISGTDVSEGCNPSGINDAIRQMMADIATDALIRNVPSTTGSGTTYVVALVPAAVSLTNLVFICKANFTSGGADTINPNSLGAKAIYKKTTSGPAAIAAGDIQSGDIVLFAYDGTHMQLLSAVPSSGGTAAAANTGTSGHTLPYLDGTNTWSGVNTLGAPVATSIAFSPTTGGIIGTTTNDNAGSGKVGEFISSSIASGSAVSLSSAIPADVTSISLTAGDWDVRGSVIAKPGSGTTHSLIEAWCSTTSGTRPTLPNGGAYSILTFAAVTGDLVNSLQSGTMRLSLSTTTTVYLSTSMQFGVSTMGAYGFIGARRIR